MLAADDIEVFEMLHFVRVVEKISRLWRTILFVLLRCSFAKTLLPSPLLRMLTMSTAGLI